MTMQQQASFEQLAARFHEIYEELAPLFGYKTREDTKVFDPKSINGALMIGVVRRLFLEGDIIIPGQQANTMSPWIYKDTPDKFARDLQAAVEHFGNFLSGVRYHFIEKPPELKLTVRDESMFIPFNLQINENPMHGHISPGVSPYDLNAIEIHVVGPSASGRTMVAALIERALNAHHSDVSVVSLEGDVGNRTASMDEAPEKIKDFIKAPKIQIFDLCCSNSNNLSRIPQWDTTLYRTSGTVQKTEPAEVVGFSIDVVEHRFDFRTASGALVSSNEILEFLRRYFTEEELNVLLSLNTSATDRVRLLGNFAELIVKLRPAPERPFVGEDHPRYLEWHNAVDNGDTLLGLADWLEHNPEEDVHAKYDLMVEPVFNQAITVTVSPHDNLAAIDEYMRKWLAAEGTDDGILAVQAARAVPEGDEAPPTKIDVFVEANFHHAGKNFYETFEFTSHEEVDAAMEERRRRIAAIFEKAVRLHLTDSKALEVIAGLFPTHTPYPG